MVNALDLAYGVGLTALSPVLAWKRFRHGKYRESLPAMFGGQLDQAAKNHDWSAGCVWVHAVSVGEVGAAKAVIPHLRQAFPDLPILATTVTETGQAAAKRQLAGLVDEIAYWPADFSWVVARFLAVFRPRILVLMETELWPNVLRMAAASGTAIFTMNGKISRRSFPRYQRLNWLLGPALRCIRGWCVQTEADAQRVAHLTGHPWPQSNSPILVTGNVKFDLTIDPPLSEELDQLRQRCGLVPADRALVVGSTHPGEEEALLEALHPVVSTHRDVSVILVPRHPERFPAVWEFLQKSEWSARRFSDGAISETPGPRVILVDAMGLLLKFYAMGEFAVVAGSFVGGIGGHNVLEPAALGKAVLFGPDMKGQPEMAQALLDGGGGLSCNLEQLRATVADWLADSEKSRTMGLKALEAVISNRGAARRSVDHMLRVLSSGVENRL